MIAAAYDGSLVSLNFVQGPLPQGKPADRLNEPFKSLKDWLYGYFTGQPPAELPSLGPQGTPFQTAVWDYLLKIPYGTITSYSCLAEAVRVHLGRSAMASQAVGQAVGRNPLAIIVPCHRVVGKNGELVGYASGLNLKSELLRREGLENDGEKLTAKLVFKTEF
jgi:methylated-DNA-[protein]-cysteine S-methyltransferase